MFIRLYPHVDTCSSGFSQSDMDDSVTHTRLPLLMDLSTAFPPLPLRCEAYVVLGDADLALGALESLQAASGTTKLLRKKHLTDLLCEGGGGKGG